MEQRSYLQVELVKLARDRLSLEMVAQSEAAWVVEQEGWKATLDQRIDDDGLSWYAQTLSHGRAVLALLVVELAIQAYQDRVGKAPTSLDDLDLPPEVLIDPCSKVRQPFRTKIRNGEWVVYSVGKNGVDDQCKQLEFYHDAASKGDLLLKEYMQEKPVEKSSAPAS